MIKSKNSPLMVGKKVPAVKTAISLALLTAMSGVVQAQEQGQLEEVVVTGFRKSLEDAMSLKRESQGVVDAINAEDMGKFPSTNLAESLQRIPGVSINRVNGEGSQVTVRGFGASFNQVTLNGRTMPTADVPEVGGGTDGRGAVGGDGRAFDFSNLASDSVRGLEVYKTGRANVASGGIGATINVKTLRPLDESENVGVISVKGIADTTVDTGDSITPEVGGSFSWANEEGTFGLALTTSYAERQSAAASATSASWNVLTWGEFQDLITDDTVVTNAPTDTSDLVTLPRDSRYHFSEFESERLNGQVVMQFAPSDAARFTVDYTFAVNEGQERRSDVSNWFNRPFTEVVFDDSPVQTTTFLREATGNQGAAMQQTLRSTKDELESLGFNAEFDINDSLTLNFDAHSSSSKVSPNAPGGYARINVGLDMKYAPVDGTLSHGVDYSGDLPVMVVELVETDANRNLSNAELADLTVDTARAGTQVANLKSITQENDVDQMDFHADWSFDDGSTLTAGVNYRSQTNLTENVETRQILGNWGAENPGDVEALAGVGSLEEFCISCRFNHHTIGGATLDPNTPNPVVHSIRGNAEDIFFAVSDAYAAGYNGAEARAPFTLSNNSDEIQEDVLALYVQFENDIEVGGKEAQLTVGLRYEDTDVKSNTSTLPTASIIWEGNNDFATTAASGADSFSVDSSYDNLLPNVDLSVNLSDDLVMRTAYSKTIARATYNNLFASSSVNAPNGPTATAGNQATASQGNPSLLPVESENFDLSFEWYYNESSYASIGYFEKRVRNFVGRETVDETLVGLRDASSGVAGSRSGDALDILESLGVDSNDDNYFAMTHYVNISDSLADAEALFVANQGTDGNIDAAIYEGLETNFDIIPDENDPEFVAGVNKPRNNKEAKIDGIELQAQHFFGDSGFGILASYTLVNGNVGFDVAGDPGASQFALPGLSDTANLTLVYENYGFTTRLAYNWRDEFLITTNDGSGFNNPIFTDAYTQIDLSVGYDVTDNLSLSFAGINLNEETSRNFSRSDTDVQFIRENGARYYLGARYKF